MEDNIKKEARNVIPMTNTFNYISPRDLDDIMEWLEDNKYLSETGKNFKTAFWRLFICQHNSKSQDEEMTNAEIEKEI